VTGIEDAAQWALAQEGQFTTRQAATHASLNSTTTYHVLCALASVGLLLHVGDGVWAPPHPGVA
jgi:hypothetical protein